MNDKRIPRPVVKRLSVYLRHFERAARQGDKTLTSKMLAETLDITSALVRRDLAHLKRMGRPGVGYDVTATIEQLRRVLGTDEVRNVVVIGVGGLGGALLCYEGFRKRGFHLVAAFDVDNRKVGKKIGGVTVHDLATLRPLVRKHGVKLAILATPSEAAQDVMSLLCRSGITGVLNFTPVTLAVPPEVSIAQVDIAARLERLSYFTRAADS